MSNSSNWPNAPAVHTPCWPAAVAVTPRCTAERAICIMMRILQRAHIETLVRVLHGRMHTSVCCGCTHRVSGRHMGGTTTLKTTPLQSPSSSPRIFLALFFFCAPGLSSGRVSETVCSFPQHVPNAETYAKLFYVPWSTMEDEPFHTMHGTSPGLVPRDACLVTVCHLNHLSVFGTVLCALLVEAFPAVWLV
jgi:hypothetical protein